MPKNSYLNDYYISMGIALKSMKITQTKLYP